MAKHAYLIIAHNNFAQLKLLCEMLDYENNDIWIHVDANAKDFQPERFQPKMHDSKVRFADRVRVNWGGYSLVQAELNLLKAAVNSETEYSCYHLLSGVDLPLRPAREIWTFFEQRKGTEFLHFCARDFTLGQRVQERARCYHLLQERVGRSTGMLYRAERCLVELQKLLGVNRLKHNGVQRLFCGSQWFSISDDLAHYVLEQETWIRKTFSYGCCVDECFLPTLVMNSEFSSRLSGPPEMDDYHGNMRWIDWGRGSPYTFQDEDFESLIQSDFMFARKFDLKGNPELIRKIYTHCRDNNHAAATEAAKEEAW